MPMAGVPFPVRDVFRSEDASETQHDGRRSVPLQRITGAQFHA
jgi:hypothetical protein